MVGCAQERDPINRVQADALAKSFFVGNIADVNDDPIFYWRNFVVDGSEAQSMVGIGSWGGVDRVRWEVTEHMLIARKAYPIAGYADDKGAAKGTQANGTLVAAYPIQSHFDIKRDYNPQTGEELNVINENQSDRPWYEREYMRVDWSMNMVNTPLWFDMFAGKLFGEIVVTPLAYYVNDQNHPDAPHFDAKEGYFDVTNKFWVEPEQMQSPFIDLSGTIPACLLIGFYTGTAVNNCDPQEAVVRSSYWRVDKVPGAADFESLENTHASLDIIGNPGGLGSSFQVGIVTPPRVDWDPQYGYTDENMNIYMHAHPIWTQSHLLRGTCASDADCGGGACLPVPDEMGKPTAQMSCTVACSYKARNDGDNNGTDDQCENANTGYQGNQGSQCSARNWCTLPFRDRKIKTVGYWINQETPAELTDPLDANGNPILDSTGKKINGPTEELTYSWNQLMAFSVAKAREVECRKTGAGDRAACRDTYFEPRAGDNSHVDMVSMGAWGIDKVKPLEDEVLVTCHNPVRAYDHKVCGEVGYSARVGDVRHNFMYYWPYASRAPWGGIANWNADPLTGMIIGGAATTMGRSATYAAAMVRDIIMVANGELSMSDITNGTPATLYERRLQNGHTPAKALTPEELNQRVNNIDAKHAMEMIAPKELAGKTAQEKLLEMTRMIPNTVAGIGPNSTSALQYEAIAEKVRGSEFEAQLVDNNWVLDAAGMNPKTTTIKDVMELVSPLRGMDEGRMGGIRQLIDLRMQARGICFPDIWAGNVGNMDVQGVSKYFAGKYNNDAIKQNFPEYAAADDATLSKKRAELIYTELWKETFKGIALHEVGHSLGMLHQFASSFDSLNFLPQYWQLRTNETPLIDGANTGGAAVNCNGKSQADGTACMGPRYLDPETPDELGQDAESRPGLAYFGHTSTMEYQNERFFENVGLGTYDLLAMNVLYGRILPTMDQDAAFAGPQALPYDEQEPFSYRNWSQLTEQNYVDWTTPLGSFMQPMHYTEQARRMKVFDPAACRPATEDEKAVGKWRIVHGKVCQPAPKDYASWYDMENSIPETAPSWMAEDGEKFVKWRVRPGVQGTPQNVRWPFRWGVTSNSYPHTNPSDAGADIYEVVRGTIEKFEYSYPFTYFRRQNRDWYYRNVPSRVVNGFYERLRASHWSMANANARFRSFGDSVWSQISGSDDWWRPYVVAETDMFNAISKSLLMPQIGPYKPLIKPVGSVETLFDVDDGSSGVNVPAQFEIDASTGRFIDPDFKGDADGGGSWNYQDWVNHTGYTVEKAEAARALSDGRGVFFTISRENYLDGRNVNINFRTDMPQAMDRLFGGLLSGDYETIAPYVLASDTADLDGNGIANPVVRMSDLTAAAPARPAGALPLFPNVGYKQALGGLVNAHIFARLNGDLGLSNKMRIWVDGLTGEINIPDASQIRFTNPESGYTYVAKKYGPETINGKTVDRGIASRMVERAQLLAVANFETNGVDAYGSPIVVLDANGDPKRLATASDTSVSEFRLWIGYLDAAVQIQTMVGYGPFYGWYGIDYE